MKIFHYKFPAATLPEVLVMMILAGILLLTVSEGITLLKRFSFRLAGAIGNETDYYNHYYTLGEWTARAREMVPGPDSCVILRFSGRAPVVLLRKDTLLLALAGERPDTLFRRTISVGIQKGEPEGLSADTLWVRLLPAATGPVGSSAAPAVSTEPFVLKFVRRPDPADTLLLRLENIEKEYAYEP